MVSPRLAVCMYGKADTIEVGHPLDRFKSSESVHNTNAYDDYSFHWVRKRMQHESPMGKGQVLFGDSKRWKPRTAGREERCTNVVSPCKKPVFVMKKRCNGSICPNKTRKQTGEVSVVISAFVTPHDGPCDTSLPVLNSPTRDGGKSRAVSTDEAHALRLDNGIDDDGIPDEQEMSLEREREREQESDGPFAVIGEGVGMIDPVPTLGLDQIPPIFIFLVAGHDNMPGVHTRILGGQLFLYLPHTAGEDGNGGETFLRGVTVAPVGEISMPLVDGDVLWTWIRNRRIRARYV
jgi:hypothetical protein